MGDTPSQTPRPIFCLRFRI